MEKKKAPENLEELLERLEDAAENNHEVSVDLVMDEVGRRSFGPLLLVAGLIMSAPVVGDIPGVPVLLGIFILLVSAQLLIARDHFWLPQWLLKRSVSSKKLKQTTDRWLRPPAKFIDRFLGRRLEIFTGPAGSLAIAFASSLIALATPAAEFIPFSANALGIGIAIFGLALIAHDGLIALTGWIIVILTASLATYWAL